MPTTDAPPAKDDAALATPARAQLAVTILLVALYVAARLWRLTASCLWFDEIFSLHAARHTWGGMWRFAAADLIHPPLFYALLKIWTAAGGDSLLWLRLFPALTSVLALVPFLLLARELRLGAAATDVALLLMAADGYLIKYAQEVRMYSLLLTLTLLSLWLFAKLLNAERTTRGLFLALFFVNLLLVYTHYYGWLVVACEAAYLLFRDRRKLPTFLPASAALAILYVPWVAACARASAEGGGLAQNIGWIARPVARDLWQFFALLNEPFYFRQSSDEPLYARGGAPLGLLLVGLPVLILLLRTPMRRRHEAAQAENADGENTKRDDDGGRGTRNDEHGRRDDDEHEARDDGGRTEALLFLSFFTALPVALAFAASYALPQSVWGERHLIVVAAPYALLAGVALARLRPFWLKSGLLIILCCWFLAVGALSLARREGTYIWCAWGSLAASAATDEARSDLNAAAQTTQSDSTASAAQTVTVYAFEDLVAYHLWFALDGDGARRFRVVVLKGLPGLIEDPAYFLPRRFDGVGVARADSINDGRFWAAFRDAAWDESHEPLKTILARGYRAERVYETTAQGQRAFLVLFKRA